MPHSIEPSILRILKSKDHIVGTGFLVSSTLAVTCAHVAMAAGLDGENRIRVQFTGQKQPIHATMLDEFLDLDRDIAILQLESVPEGIQPLRLGLAEHSRPGNTFRSFGYATAASLQGIFANGNIDGYLPQHKVVQLQSPQANHGMSGAPVFDERRGVAIGMITKGHTELGRNENTTFATPMELIFKACPEIQPDETCPYLGLESFSAETERFFFGRTALTEKLLTTINRGCRFLAIFGPSGSGKSSVVRAGLLPALKKSQPWAQFTIRPADDPFAQLRAEGLDLSNIPATKTILFIDQFEELFTCINEICERFVRELADALENSNLILIIAMRDDFYSAFNAKATPLAASPHRVVVDVPVTIEHTDLVTMIEQPAATVGLTLEEGLAELIIKDAAPDGTARSSTLPLLEFTVTQLWDKRHDGLLTHDAYQSIGGVIGSLARCANNAYRDLPKAEQPLAENLLTALVHLGDESQGLPDTRRRRTLAEFDQATQRVIQHFASPKRRLLVTSGETVELVHDALVCEWVILKRWLADNRRFLVWRQKTIEKYQEWKESKGELLRGRELSEAQGFWKERPNDLHELTRYISLSIRKQKRQRGLFVGTISIVLIIFVFLALWGQNNAMFANNKALTADAAKATAAGEANSRATAQANAVGEISARGTAQTNEKKQKKEAEKQSQIAIARQLAAQAQTLFVNGNSGQMAAVLLSIQSMRMFPVTDAAQILRDNLLAHYVTRTPYDELVTSIAFNPDSQYIALAGEDKIIRVREIITSKEVARMVLDDWIYSIAFSPNGKYIASASADKTVRVWEAFTGKEIARMLHDDRVFSIAFSSDSRYVVSGSADKTIRVWETTTGKEVANMTPNSYVNYVTFSPNNKYLLSRSADNTVRVWDMLTRRELSHIMYDSYVSSVVFSPDSKYVAVGSEDKTARVWEATTGREIARMTHDDFVWSVAFSPDGKYVVSGSNDRTARVWETITGREMARVNHDDSVHSVAFSPDGKYVVSGSGDKTARMWDAKTGKEIFRMTQDDLVYFIAFSPDGKYIATRGAIQQNSNIAFDRGYARVWDVSTHKEIALMKHDSGVTTIAFSPDGKYVVSGSDNKTIRVWEATTGKETSRMMHDEGVTFVAFSPDGKYVVSSGCDQIESNNGCIQSSTRVWDALTGKEIARMTHNSIVWASAFSPDGKYVVSVGEDRNIQIWKVATGNIITLEYDASVQSIAYSPNGKYIILGGCDQFDFNELVCVQGSARVWKVDTYTEVARMTSNDEVAAVAFSPDSKYVVSGGCDQRDTNKQCIQGFARVWEITTGKEVASMKHDDQINAVVFSPNGKYVVSGSDDATARIWDVSTGMEIARLTQGNSVKTVAFSADGKYVASGGCDEWPNNQPCVQGSARILDIATGQEIARIIQDGGVNAVAFSPDSKYVVSASDDKTARVWLYRPEDLIADSCSRVTRNLTRAEWTQYIRNALPYQAICPNLPIEPEPILSPVATPTP